MIKDEELLNLPDDPEEAFVEYERIIRERANIAITNATDKEVDADPYRIDYMSHVLAAVKMLNLNILQNWNIPGASDTSIPNIYQNFVSDVNFIMIQMRFNLARRTRRYSVALNPKTKSVIRHHLKQIKELVDRLDVSEKKKNRLYAKIMALENEVHRDRTRFDALMALVLEGSSTAGVAAENLKPVTKRIRELMDVFGSAKAEEDEKSPQLPAPIEPKQIEPPKHEVADGDDEIPF